jgi:hypothetical protein
MTNEAAAKAKALLLEEVKTGKLGWYYISISNLSEFYGGCLIEARGPTEAWFLMHRLGIYPAGGSYSTSTSGPFDPEPMQKIPEEQRWRRLSQEEVHTLGE